jgi:hypothetical protein
MNYKILITYDTGNSFGREYDKEDFLTSYERKGVLTWNNLDIVKENLKRIKEHYIGYLDVKHLGRLYFDKKELKRKEESNKKERWYPRNLRYGEDLWHLEISLLDDNSEPFNASSFWTGYFETLTCAEVYTESNDLKITF